MLKCPVCNTPYTEGKKICSSCLWVFNGNEQQTIDWARNIWNEKCEFENKCQALELENKQLREGTKQDLDQQNLSSPSEAQEQLLKQIQDKQAQAQHQLLKQIQDRQSQAQAQLLKQIQDKQSQAQAQLLKQIQDKQSQAKEQLLQQIQAERVQAKEQLLKQIQDQQVQAQEQLLKQIEDKQAQAQEQLLKQIQAERQDELKKINTKLGELKEFSEAKKKVYEDSSLAQAQDVNIHQSQTKAKQELSWEEHQLVKEYNENRENLSKRASEVSETEKSITERRMSSSSKVIFEEKRRGNYLILKEGDSEYLVPSNHLRINQHNYKTVEALFECRGFQPEYSEYFLLVKPAKVSAGNEERTWQLDEPGILEFQSNQ